MKIDDLDTEILTFLIENPNKSSWDIARVVSRRKNPRDIAASETLVRYHLRRLMKYGIVERMPTVKTSLYSASTQKVFLGSGALVVPVKQMREPFSIDLGEFIVVTNGSNQVVVKSIDEVAHRVLHETKT